MKQEKNLKYSKLKKLDVKMKKVLLKSLADILYAIEIRIMKKIYVWLSLHPSSKPFLSGDTYRKLSTIEYLGGKIELTKPEIIFSSGDYINELSHNLINAKQKFILITHHSDRSIDPRYRLLAENPQLIKWYAQNNEYLHQKITPIPIGLEDRWRHNNGIVRDFIALRAKIVEKKPRILFGFTVSNNESERAPALAVLRNLAVADEFLGSSRRYRKILMEYMFVASPPGNGIDCHRTWEALYLGVIPIVITRKFHEQFKDLPLLIVNEWADLASYGESDLKDIYEEQAAKLKKLDYIWFDFWKKSIESDLVELS